MTRFVGTPLRGIEFSSVSDEAVSTRILGDSQARIRIDAGGRLTWSSGSAAGDVNLYRDGANLLTTDDVFEATGGLITLVTNGVPTEALANGAIAVDTTNHVFYFRSNDTWNEVQSGANVTIASTAPAGAEEGDLWFNSTDLELYIFYGSAFIQLTDTGSIVQDLDDLADVEITSPATEDVIAWDGEKWVNSPSYNRVTVSATAPATDLREGELWYNTTDLEVYIYYSSAWVQLTGTEQLVQDLDDLVDVDVASATTGQFLKFDGINWVADDIPTINTLDDVGDVTITSPANGDFLRWNGTAWINDAVNLSTDTVGDYVESLVAGTGINITNNSGEAATPTVSLDATLDELSDVSASTPTAGQFLKWNGTAWVPDDIPTINTLDDVGDVTITSAVAGEVLVWNGTAWVNGEGGANLTVSETPPVGPSEGDMWFESDTGATFVYYDSTWVEIGNSGAVPVPSLDAIGDVDVASATSGQFLKWDGTNWVADDIPTINTLDDVGDVTITSATSGDFLKWNGTAWVNDPINLGTDTTGNYVSGLTAGTGISVTHTPAEGSSPTVALDATLDNLSNVNAPAPTDGQFLKYVGASSEWQPANIPTINYLDDIGDVTITSVATGDLLQWNGTAWVNAVGNMSSLGDVNIVAPEAYQTLVYDGTEWINEYPTTVSLVNNAEATTLQVGEAVYLFGGTGNHASVKRADNDSDATSAKTVGLVAEAIPAGGNGPVVTRGYVTGINLSVGYTEGQTLYLGESGGLTTTKPTAPEHLVYIGVVVRATSNGIIYVAAQNGYELDELHNVAITSPEANYDILRYNSTSGLWVNSAGQDIATTANPSFAGVTADNVQIGITAAGEIDTSTGNLTIDSAGGTVTVDDNLVVSGDLTVNGTTTTLNTADLLVEDNIVVLNSGVTGAPSLNAGVEVERGSSANVAVRWNESTDTWQITEDGTNYYDIATSEDISGVAISALDDIGDVTITSASAGDALVWNGTAWINDTIVGGATVSATAPASPEEGAIWFDTESGLAFVYFSSTWVEIGGPGAGANVAVSSVPPASPSEGDLWFDSDVAATFVYYDSSWVEVGASGFAAVVADVEPSNPEAGQLWFNSTDGGTYIYYDSTWMEIGAAPFNTLLSTIDAKGDLLVGTAADTVGRLATGTSGQVLSVNTATTTGLEWTTLSYAPLASPTFTGTVTLPSDTSIGTVSATEIGYLDGVTSSVQTQLNTKASTGKAIAMAIVFGG